MWILFVAWFVWCNQLYSKDIPDDLTSEVRIEGIFACHDFSFITTPRSQPLCSIPQKIPSPTCLLLYCRLNWHTARERGSVVSLCFIFTNPPEDNKKTHTHCLFGMIHRERRNEVMPSHLPPYHAAAQKLERGAHSVCPTYHAAARAQKEEWIVYGNPGTRVPDTRVRLTPPPLKR